VVTTGSFRLTENQAAPGLAGDIALRQEAREIFGQRQALHLHAVLALDGIAGVVEEAAARLVLTLRRGRRVYTVGNGGSASEAQHFACELAGRFLLDREPWPVMALTADSAVTSAIANDYGYASVFARQVEAFVQPGDLLIAYSTSGRSANVVRAAAAARDKGAVVVAITGRRASPLGETADVAIRVPADDTPTIQEMHGVLTHTLCQVAESVLARDEREHLS
jgi:D-sedoheptulose 7-phosphate isomerase